MMCECKLEAFLHFGRLSSKELDPASVVTSSELRARCYLVKYPKWHSRDSKLDKLEQEMPVWTLKRAVFNYLYYYYRIHTFSCLQNMHFNVLPDKSNRYCISQVDMFEMQ